MTSANGRIVALEFNGHILKQNHRLKFFKSLASQTNSLILNRTFTVKSVNSLQCRDPTIHERTPVRSDMYRKQEGTKSRGRVYWF